MISLVDLIGFCDLTPDEVHAIAEHEHIADALAIVFGTSLLQATHGPEQIRDILVDELRTAIRRRDIPQARHLVSTLRHFLHEHPAAAFRRAA